MTHAPMNLGAKLARETHKAAASDVIVFWSMLVALILTAAAVLWIFSQQWGQHPSALLIAGMVLTVVGVGFALRSVPWPKGAVPEPHFLIAGDSHGFMADLRLDEKTAVFDGSNIYHFGQQNGLDVQPIGLLAAQLRAEGCRVVCFFDANIYYTLSEHGVTTKRTRHKSATLEAVFGLHLDEIYVVPSGVQADRFVLTTLRHLPKAFAVTNDKFRDYSKDFSAVMKGDQWRKGVDLRTNELRLHKHRFQTPVTVA